MSSATFLLVCSLCQLAGSFIDYLNQEMLLINSSSADKNTSSKANSPELKALRQFSMYFLKDGPFLSGFLTCGGAPSVAQAEWGCWRCSPRPRAGLAAAGGLQCSGPAYSSCCIPHPGTLSGNLHGSQCPAVHCQNSEKKSMHH